MTAPLPDGTMLDPAECEGEELIQRSGIRAALRSAARTTEGRIGIVLLALVVTVAVIGPLVAPHPPQAFVDQPFAPPTTVARLGTDNLGRDVLSRFLFGGRTLLIMAVLATIGGVAVGTAIGLTAGSARRWHGHAMVAATDLIYVFPQILLALLVISIVGSRLWLICTLVAITHVPRVVRVVRASTADVIRQDFVESARLLGASRASLLRREVLPSVAAPILVELGLGLAFSAALLGGLSFLGFGVQAPTADWGLMINENRIGLTTAPWGVLAPTIAIAVLTVGANLLTDAVSRTTGVSNTLADLP